MKKLAILLLVILVSFYLAAAIIGHSLYWANWPGFMQRPMFAFMLGAGLSGASAIALFGPKKDDDAD